MRTRLRGPHYGTVLMAAALLLPTVAAAQSPDRPATLLVTVVDRTGGVVVGATVDLKGANGTSPVSATTDARGDAAFTLSAGRYELTVGAAGFEPRAVAHLAVPGAHAKVRVELQIARLVQEVTVGVDLKARRSEFDGLAFATILTPDQLAALPDDPAELRRVLRMMAGGNASFVVDGFTASESRPSDSSSKCGSPGHHSRRIHEHSGTRSRSSRP